MGKRSSKPIAYVKKRRTGYWLDEPVYHWISSDQWGTTIASTRTKKDCISQTRKAGYMPVDE